MWTWLDRIEGGMASVGAGLCLLAMMLMTVISVFGRYVLGMDLVPGAYNVIERILFPLLVFWALPLAHRQGTFPRLELVQQAFPARGQAAISALVLIVEVAVYAALLWYVGHFAWEGLMTSRGMQIGTVFWPVWPILIMMPIAFALMLIEMLRLVCADLRRLVSPDGGS